MKTPIKCILCDEEAAAIVETDGLDVVCENLYQPRCVQHLLRLSMNRGGVIVEQFEKYKELTAGLGFTNSNGLPKPTPKQAACKHEKWRAMSPHPRNCLECGLLMWDAGD